MKRKCERIERKLKTHNSSLDNVLYNFCRSNLSTDFWQQLKCKKNIAQAKMMQSNVVIVSGVY